jgi:hypothetical protein
MLSKKYPDGRQSQVHSTLCPVCIYQRDRDMYGKEKDKSDAAYHTGTLRT